MRKRGEKERGKKKYREIMGVEEVGGVREISREGKRRGDIESLSHLHIYCDSLLPCSVVTEGRN